MSNVNGIHHVVPDTWKQGEKSYCGREVWSYDMPLYVGHAKGCIETGTYVQPCKRCMKKVEKLSV